MTTRVDGRGISVDLSPLAVELKRPQAERSERSNRGLATTLIRKEGLA